MNSLTSPVKRDHDNNKHQKKLATNCGSIMLKSNSRKFEKGILKNVRNDKMLNGEGYKL